jgi:hypothetical protein
VPQREPKRYADAVAANFSSSRFVCQYALVFSRWRCFHASDVVGLWISHSVEPGRACALHLKRFVVVAEHRGKPRVPGILKILL